MRYGLSESGLPPNSVVFGGTVLPNSIPHFSSSKMSQFQLGNFENPWGGGGGSQFLVAEQLYIWPPLSGSLSQFFFV